MLVAHDLRKRYGSIAALDGFSLTIAPGEIVGLLGHNGAGKTTFVEIIAGLTRPDTGTAHVDGVDCLRDVRAARRRIGLAPQEIALYLPATVRDNLRMFAGLAGIRAPAARREIDRVTQALDLTAELDRPVGLLSGGQRRRVQAASALVHRPPVLLLDEPTVGADPDTRSALLAVVRERAAEGAAICYTTHYLPELDELDATLAVASAGRVVARGPRAALLAGLPGQLVVRFDGDVPPELADRGRVERDTLRISSTDPTGDLASLLAAHASTAPTAIDILRPSLDDLYRSLAVTRVG